jgi:hypothetical protein
MWSNAKSGLWGERITGECVGKANVGTSIGTMHRSSVVVFVVKFLERVIGRARGKYVIPF